MLCRKPKNFKSETSYSTSDCTVQITELCSVYSAPPFGALNGVTFYIWKKKCPYSRRNSNTAITQTLTNAVPSQWLACPSLIEMPPRKKQHKQNRSNSIFLEKIISKSVFTARVFYLALIWVHRVLTVFLWSPSHLMSLLAPVQAGTVKSSFTSITVTLSLLLFLRCFFFGSWIPTKSLALTGQNLALFPSIVKMFSYNSERGEKSVHSIWFPRVFSFFLQKQKEYMLIVLCIREILIDCTLWARDRSRPKKQNNKQEKVPSVINTFLRGDTEKLNK